MTPYLFLAYLFLAYLALVFASVAVVAAFLLHRRTAAVISAGLGIWLLYVGALSYSGVVRDPSLRPPGAFLIIVPVFLFVLTVVVRSNAARTVAMTLPIWLLIGAQSFRVGVELLLHKLWEDGLVPKLLTYEGGNIDLFIGLSAPVMAWGMAKGYIGRNLALGWNFMGLVALANVIVRSALTSPGPLNLLHSEVPNMSIGLFPYTFIAGFFAPLAITLHVLSIRSLLNARELVPDRR